MKSVSIVIRNLNESSDLEKVLTGLSVQRDVKSEVILVDNESTDNSVEIARKHGAKVVMLPRKQFTYGRALNAGLEAAENEICVILSAHSMPSGRDFLAACCEPFDIPDVAAARCVCAGKHSDQLRWTAPEVLRGDIDFETVISKGPLASGCVIRRSVWQKVGFDETVNAAEDKKWAQAILSRGYAIYSPCAATYFYLKKISRVADVKKQMHDIEAIYNYSTRLVGFARASTTEAISGLLKSLFISTPVAAVTVAHVSFLVCFYTLHCRFRRTFNCVRKQKRATIPPARRVF